MDGRAVLMVGAGLGCLAIAGFARYVRRKMLAKQRAEDLLSAYRRQYPNIVEVWATGHSDAMPLNPENEGRRFALVDPTATDELVELSPEMLAKLRNGEFERSWPPIGWTDEVWPGAIYNLDRYRK